MARIGIVLIIAAIVVSMAIAMVFYLDYQPNIINAKLGEEVTVGPVKYILTYDGIEKGSKEIESDATFMKINIISEGLSGEAVTAEKKQFSLVDKQGKQTKPTHGIFTKDSPAVVAYFPLVDEELDEEFQYNILIRPTKEQRSTDLAVICVTQCE